MRNFTWNRFPIKNLLIDSLLTPIVESTYLFGRIIEMWKTLLIEHPTEKNVGFHTFFSTFCLCLGGKEQKTRFPFMFLKSDNAHISPIFPLKDWNSSLPFPVHTFVDKENLCETWFVQKRIRTTNQKRVWSENILHLVLKYFVLSCCTTEQLCHLSCWVLITDYNWMIH